MQWMHLVLDTPPAMWVPGVQFWATVTGTRSSVDEPGTSDANELVPVDGTGWLAMRRVLTGPSGVHLVLEVDAPDEVVSQAVRRGATREAGADGDGGLRSPGGLPFRVVQKSGPRTPWIARGGPGDIADQVCIDVPPGKWSREVPFWRDITGRVLETGLRPEFAFLGDPDPGGPPRVLLQRLNSPAGNVAAHLDLVTADRARSVAQHERLGAQVRAVYAAWTVMTAPSGHSYCLTDRDPTTGRVRRQRTANLGPDAGARSPT